MTMIYTSVSPEIKKILAKKKYRIVDPLSEQLIRSLTTKVFYTLAHFKLFDELEGSIDLGPVIITPYRSIVGDIRYIITLVGLQDEPVIVQWNGKFEKLTKKTPDFFISLKDFNVTNCLDNFVKFEQSVVAKLHDIENKFFKPEKVVNGND